jgi:hypothetical protein
MTNVRVGLYFAFVVVITTSSITSLVSTAYARVCLDVMSLFLPRIYTNAMNIILWLVCIMPAVMSDESTSICINEMFLLTRMSVLKAWCTLSSP